MTAAWIEQITGSFDDKKRWRQYKARKQQLPASYRTAIDGLERYLTYAGAVSKGDVLVQMFEDLADLIERAATDGTPIREIVGDEPVEFAEAFLENYADGQWINKERARLVDSIDRAVADGA
jgi:DNA-binding ferritin-like protein (Dps family)